MLSIGFTKPRPKSWDHSRLVMARAKNGFSGAVIHLARTGRYGALASSLGCSPIRNLAGTTLADSGSLFFPPIGRSDSTTLGTVSFLPAFLKLSGRTLVKKAAIAQY